MEFNANTIDIIMDDLNISALDAGKKIVLDAHRGFVDKTPRKLGRAVNSWNIRAGKPDKSVPPIGKYGEPKTPTVNYTKLVPIYCTSSLSYMPALEDGHSKQGKHMVKRTINEITQQLPR